MSDVMAVEHAACLPDGLAPDAAIPSEATWFDVRERLGRRGYRQLPLPAQLTLAAVRGLALPSTGGAEGVAAVGGEDPGPADTAAPHAAGERHGVWLGSSTAAAHCLANLDNRILAEGTESVLPTGAPYFSVNLVPVRAVTELGATGPSVTMTSTGTAALDAIACAARAVRLGRVEQATVVAVEVPDPDRDLHHSPECGAFAIRLRGDAQGARLRSVSAFAALDPATASDRVLAGLAVDRSTPVLVSAPVAVAAGEDLGGGPLACVGQLVAAMRDGRDLVVIVADPTGAAVGVVVEHTGGPNDRTDNSRRNT